MTTDSREVRAINGRECLIYSCGSSERLLIQPVDDHDIEVFDNQVSEIRRLTDGTGFTLAAFRVNDWNEDLSPSVWFPGWIEYAEDNSVKAEKVYLSLGDKEEKTRNPVMKMVGDNIRRQIELLEGDPHCLDCVLEMNQGNHFKEPDLRTAKGFAWLLAEKNTSDNAKPLTRSLPKRWTTTRNSLCITDLCQVT